MRRLLAVCGLGVVFGAATSLSNWLGSQFDADSIARIPSLILDAGWTWAAFGLADGSRPRLGRVPPLASALGLIAATVAYFGVDAIVRDEPLGSYTAELVRWWGVSILAGPILGLVGALARSPTVPGLLARFVIPVAATPQVLGIPSAISPVASPAVTAARLLLLAAAAVATIAVIARLARSRRRHVSA